MRLFLFARRTSLVACGPALIATAFAGVAIRAEEQPAADAVAPAAAGVSAPEPAARPAPAITVYPQVSMASFTREYRSRPLPLAGGANEAVAAIEKALDRRDVNLHFSETPLRDVVSQLQDELKLPVSLEIKSLEDAGVDLDLPITFTQSGTSLRAALNRMLGQLELSFTIADESLVITSQEAAWEHPVVRLYPLPWGIAAEADRGLKPLLDLIHTTIDPDSWDTNGGPGSIKPVGDLGDVVLVVSQTQEIHAEVEGLLRGLHQRAFAEFGDAETPRAAVPVCRVLRVADAPPRAALAEKLVELCNASLGRSGDPDARVTEVGESLVVQSVSPEFQALAARMVAAIAGVARPGHGGGAAVMGGIGGGGPAPTETEGGGGSF
jgi:hypothetical protein